MQHLLRNQIISIVLLLITHLSVNAQKNEVFRPDYDEMRTHIGAYMGVGINNLNFERSSTFGIPQTNYPSEISSPNNIHVNLGLTSSLRFTNHLQRRVKQNYEILAYKSSLL